MSARRRTARHKRPPKRMPYLAKPDPWSDYPHEGTGSGARVELRAAKRSERRGRLWKRELRAEAA